VNKRTPLFDRHVELGARVIDFGGWDMPVQYPPGIIKEHKAVRESAGLFDVSHMGEAWLRGAGATAAVQRIVTNDAGKLADGQAMYTVMCLPSGGIVDDCIVYRRRQDQYLIVLNAGNAAKDVAWLREHAGADVTVDDQSEATALIAVQGPNAVATTCELSDIDLAEVPRFSFAECNVAGVDVLAARTGYTGEDGFELACSADYAVDLWDALLEQGAQPIGLGARDTLRLEARLCLYGNDIDESTNPYEAGLAWVVKPDAKDFIGKDALRAAKAAGIARKLVGFVIHERAIARHGYPILSGGERVGEVTSGTKGISVDGAIGMGYVPVELGAVGSTITIDCRGKEVAATIVKGAFYQR
jgi:aminomethyltransferase